MNHDQDYFARRVQQERDRAARSNDGIAQRLHQEMAERYAARLRELAPQQQQTFA